MGVTVRKVLEKEIDCSMRLGDSDAIVVEHRSNNPKRDFLFVNKYQGKHIPTSPSKYSKMMDQLAEEIKVITDNRKDILIIGFAETATAMAAEIADRLNGYVYYMQTTREKIGSNEYRVVDFQEEHSHAVEQELYGDWTKLCKTDEKGELIIDEFGRYIPNDWGFILLIDDEITTGKTVLNIVSKLKTKINMDQVEVGVASICNWQKDEDVCRFTQAGIKRAALVYGNIKATDIKLGCKVYPESHWDLEAVDDTDESGKSNICKLNITNNQFNYTDISKIERCGRTAEQEYRVYGVQLFKDILEKVGNEQNICIVGTEEFMYIPGIVAQLLQARHKRVRLQATTRSSIDVMIDSEIQGIYNKIKLPSVYDKERKTFLYNIAKYDKVIVITDGKDNIEEFAQHIVNAFEYYGNKRDNIEIVMIQ